MMRVLQNVAWLIKLIISWDVAFESSLVRFIMR